MSCIAAQQQRLKRPVITLGGDGGPAAFLRPPVEPLDGRIGPDLLLDSAGFCRLCEISSSSSSAHQPCSPCSAVAARSRISSGNDADGSARLNPPVCRHQIVTMFW